jgi:hypothetical protein
LILSFKSVIWVAWKLIMIILGDFFCVFARIFFNEQGEQDPALA